MSALEQLCQINSIYVTRQRKSYFPKISTYADPFLYGAMILDHVQVKFIIFDEHMKKKKETLVDYILIDVVPFWSLQVCTLQEKRKKILSLVHLSIQYSC